LRLLGITVVGVVIVGTSLYALVEGWSWLDGFYMTVTTLTTVGFGEIRPLDTSGRVMTIGLIFSGVTLFLLALSLLAQLVQEGALGERGRLRRMQKQIGDLKGHVIVAGYGRVGRAVAQTLQERRVDCVVIDARDDREREISEDGLLYWIGDATLEDDLHHVGVTRAKALITAVDDDGDNIFITMVARSLGPDLWIVARASEQTSIDRLKLAGADRVYSPYVSAGRQMADAAIEAARGELM
jgi:voltage-gated potassium channel